MHGRARPPKPGEVGEVVVTDLHNFGMPFIRYANGDLAEASPVGRCRCGRALPRIAAVQGRVTDALVDGRQRIAGFMFLVMFASHLADAVRRYQVVQHRDRSITLRLVLARPLNQTDRAHIAHTDLRQGIAGEDRGGRRNRDERERQTAGHHRRKIVPIPRAACRRSPAPDCPPVDDPLLTASKSIGMRRIDVPPGSAASR